MDNFYKTNKDFKDFVDANARAYGKSVEFMMLTPTAKEYADYLKERNKGKVAGNENKVSGRE